MPTTRAIRFLLNGVESAAETYFRGTDKVLNVNVIKDDGEPHDLSVSTTVTNIEWFTSSDRTDAPLFVTPVAPDATNGSRGYGSITFADSLAIPRGTYFLYLRTDDGVSPSGQIDALTIVAAGVGFEVVPTLAFIANSGGTGATATCTVSGGLKRINPSTVGSGYVSTPAVVITAPSAPGGVQATATAVVDYRNSTLTGITLTAKGTGFTTPPTVSASGSGGAGQLLRARMGFLTVPLTSGGTGYTTATVGVTGGGGAGATFTAVIASGVVTGITVTAPGNDYTSLPTAMTITGDGTGAVINLASVRYQVEAIAIDAPGTGWQTLAPVISISGGGGSGATATATANGGVVGSYTLGTLGSGYTAPPTVALIGGLSFPVGTAATATALLSASITSVTLTAPGTGYQHGATVAVNGGNPTTAAVITDTVKRGLTLVAELPSSIQIK